MTIHMFGAYFGLALSYVLGEPIDEGHEETMEPDKESDLFALVGTTLLWVYWPSFVGATETSILENEKHCITNTILALLSSTTMTFYLSHKLTHSNKFDPVHVANSTLAGGVAIGSTGRLNIGPGAAIIVGMFAGVASVYGYVYSSPYLESKYKIYDTCGVGNLHGYPSIVGGILSIIYVTLDADAEFLHYNMFQQMIRQFLGIIITLVISITSGYGTGLLVTTKLNEDNDDESESKMKKTYHDKVWWHTEYY